MNNKTSINKCTWSDLEAYMLTVGGYTAMLVPSLGANLIQLDNMEHGASILKKPASHEQYLTNPFIYGIPILFPPNRIENGVFNFNGIDYSLPINEAIRDNHLHGLLYNQEWNVDEFHADKKSASITCSFSCTEGTEVYKLYPFFFTIYLTYTLTGEGLTQKVEVLNEDEKVIPVFLGYHTTFNIPFIKNSSSDNCTIKLSTNQEWELDDRNLPTERVKNNDSYNLLTGVRALDFPFDNHYKSDPINRNGKSFNGAIITDEANGFSIVYEVSDCYKHWMLYNGFENRTDFICPEPQTCMVNAMNLKNITPQESGIITLEVNSKWTAEAKIYLSI